MTNPSNFHLSLQKLLKGLSDRCQYLNCDESTTISGLTNDSRRVVEGDIFFACSGSLDDGARYISQAIELGAKVIVVSDRNLVENQRVAVISYPDTRELLALAAHNFHENPSSKLLAVAITGTNGKTTICSILAQSLAALKGSAFSLGTLGAYQWVRTDEPKQIGTLNNTTPGAIEFQKYLSVAATSDSQCFVAEVSSHGLEQQRSRCTEWDVAVFSNFSRDHLDYHESLESYFEAKALLFSRELLESPKKAKTAILHIDDPSISALASRLDKTGVRVIRVSEISSQNADVKLIKAQCHSGGSQIRISINDKSQVLKVNTSLTGSYNVSNILLSAAVLYSANIEYSLIEKALSSLKPVTGRLQLIQSDPFSLYIDYAHTPDALEKACKALKEISIGRLIVVFGCGGDRDKGKRALMAQTVEEAADLAIVTSDNPRSEDPGEILKDITKGFTENFTNFQTEVDRRKAIKEAIALANPNDCILVAGKGHEDYQEIAGERLAFSDIQVAKELLGI